MASAAGTAPLASVDPDDDGRRRGGLGYVLLLPAALWLGIFFVGIASAKLPRRIPRGSHAPGMDPHAEGLPGRCQLARGPFEQSRHLCFGCVGGCTMFRSSLDQNLLREVP